MIQFVFFLVYLNLVSECWSRRLMINVHWLSTLFLVISGTVYDQKNEKCCRAADFNCRINFLITKTSQKKKPLHWKTCQKVNLYKKIMIIEIFRIFLKPCCYNRQTFICQSIFIYWSYISVFMFSKRILNYLLEHH